MAETVVIGGETVALPDFNAFKALVAMEIVTEVESAFREVTNSAAEYRREYEQTHVIEISRADARRRFGPEPLMKLVQETDAISQVPVLDEAGDPVLGPDPLAHITDADWEASGQILRLPESPSEDAVYTAMFPTAFKLAKTQVMRLLALAMTTNRDLEEWDGARDIDAELDERGRKLLHDASPVELIRLAATVMDITREQLRDPFDEAVSAWQNLRSSTKPDEQEEESDVAIEPMRVEPASDSETASSGTSSTDSPAGTDGTPSPSSIEPAGVSSSS